MAKQNTHQRGTLRFFLYFDETEQEFIGVCFELALVDQDKDRKVLERRLERTAKRYVASVIQNGLSDALLNQQLSREYERKYASYLQALQQHRQPARTEFTEAASFTLPVMALA